jgi:hypothetical protein
VREHEYDPLTGLAIADQNAEKNYRGLREGHSLAHNDVAEAPRSRRSASQFAAAFAIGGSSAV